MDPVSDQVTIVDETDLIVVRKVLRANARAAGLSLVEETKLITAGSELARNIVTHTAARSGELRVHKINMNGRRGVEAIFSDQGPGIDDLEAALTDGFSTAGSMGLGLPGTRRLVDKMSITSSRDSGTTVVISKWAR